MIRRSEILEQWRLAMIKAQIGSTNDMIATCAAMEVAARIRAGVQYTDSRTAPAEPIEGEGDAAQA